MVHNHNHKHENKNKENYDIPKLAIERIIKEAIVKECKTSNKKSIYLLSSKALDSLHCESENYLAEIFQIAKQIKDTHFHTSSGLKKSTFLLSVQLYKTIKRLKC